MHKAVMMNSNNPVVTMLHTCGILTATSVNDSRKQVVITRSCI